MNGRWAVPLATLVVASVSVALVRATGHSHHEPIDVDFVSDRSGLSAIWSLHGGKASQISPTGTEAYAPAVGSDGRLAFVEHIDDSFDIMVSAPAGHPHLVTSSPGPVGRI